MTAKPMTVKEMINFLKKFDGNAYVVVRTIADDYTLWNGSPDKDGIYLNDSKGELKPFDCVVFSSSERVEFENE